MRIFITKQFAKWARKNQVRNEQLRTAALEVSKNIFDANLGGFIIKKRIATKGRGKRKSIRTIIAFKHSSHCFFIYGFEKNEKDNISEDETKALKLVGKELLNFSDQMLESYINLNKLMEIK